MAFATKTTKTSARSRKANAERINLATLWPVEAGKLVASGRPQEATEDYENNSHFLSLLPAAPKGQHWEVVAFSREVSSRKGTQEVIDLVLQLRDDRR